MGDSIAPTVEAHCSRSLVSTSIVMAETSSSGALSLAYANDHAPRAAARRPSMRRRRVGRRVIVAMVAGALGWLVVGCSGLLWAIAFTADQRSLAIALAVWVLGFVAPSVLATLIAYRLEEEGLARDDD